MTRYGCLEPTKIIYHPGFNGNLVAYLCECGAIYEFLICKEHTCSCGIIHKLKYKELKDGLTLEMDSNQRAEEFIKIMTTTNCMRCGNICYNPEIENLSGSIWFNMLVFCHKCERNINNQVINRK